MGVVEDIIKMVRDYETQVGYKPTTLKLSRSQWEEINREIGRYPMYEADLKGRGQNPKFMGMNVTILEDEECIGD
jgi:hypothetical protein